jgi:invasion protein IalB
MSYLGRGCDTSIFLGVTKPMVNSPWGMFNFVVVRIIRQIRENIMFTHRVRLSLCFVFLGLMALMTLGQTTKAAAAEPLWAVRCEQGKNKNKYCEAFQRLAMTQKGDKTPKRVAEFAVGYLDNTNKTSPRAAIVLPLGIMVDQPLELQIDGKDKLAFRIRNCLADGCYAMVALQPKHIDLMKNGKQINIRALAPTGQKLDIIMSLVGFKAALGKL